MQPYQAVAAALQKNGITYLANAPLQNYTSFRIGGPAAILAMPSTAAQITQAVTAARANALPYMFLGKGSNVLFNDNGFAGVIIRPGEGLSQLTVQGNTIHAGAGVSLSQLCTAAGTAGLAGLEFAYGIPGSVGGAVYMNAGAYGGEMKDVLQQVEYITPHGQLVTADAAVLCLGYRASLFQINHSFIVSATVQLQQGDSLSIQQAMQQLMQKRVEKQPLEHPSAGSAFKRPPGAFAGALIEQCGLRGYRVGDAAISEKHCGFIVNLGNATCAEVLLLAQQVASIVYEQTGYTLEREIRVVNSDGSIC